MNTELLIFLATAITFTLAMVASGLVFREKSDNPGLFYHGGRSLAPWPAGFSGASSALGIWLLLLIPGETYWGGLSRGLWKAVGLFLGLFLSWRLVAKRLSYYSIVAGDVATIPEFLDKRFKDKTGQASFLACAAMVAALPILAGYCLALVGQAASFILGINYYIILAALVVLLAGYLVLGGYNAFGVSSIVLAVFTVFILFSVALAGVSFAGGFGAIRRTISVIPDYFSLFKEPMPLLGRGHKQLLNSFGKPMFAKSNIIGAFSVLSSMSWGLGYIGMPCFTQGFLAIRDPHYTTRSINALTLYSVLGSIFSVGAGIIGRGGYRALLLTQTESRSILVSMAASYFQPLLSGVLLAVIFAAATGAASACLISSASAVLRLFQTLLKEANRDREAVLASRIAICSMALVSGVIACFGSDAISAYANFSWALLAAAFGPVTILCLFWKRMTKVGAIVGMASGIVSAFVFNFHGLWGFYELAPAFAVGFAFTVVVSMVTKRPSKEIESDFDMARDLAKGRSMQLQRI
ncbi:MAG: hypothetical protein FWG10_09755 [Eubacteriaceae bacterium]|nr:hypothetical protein [Eubacteriaceae bacterium]